MPSSSSLSFVDERMEVLRATSDSININLPTAF
jgi:hypothetical protein